MSTSASAATIGSPLAAETMISMAGNTATETTSDSTHHNKRSLEEMQTASPTSEVESPSASSSSSSSSPAPPATNGVEPHAKRAKVTGAAESEEQDSAVLPDAAVKAASSLMKSSRAIGWAMANGQTQLPPPPPQEGEVAEEEEDDEPNTNEDGDDEDAEELNEGKSKAKKKTKGKVKTKGKSKGKSAKKKSKKKNDDNDEEADAEATESDSEVDDEDAEKEAEKENEKEKESTVLKSIVQSQMVDAAPNDTEEVDGSVRATELVLDETRLKKEDEKKLSREARKLLMIPAGRLMAQKKQSNGVVKRDSAWIKSGKIPNIMVIGGSSFGSRVYHNIVYPVIHKWKSGQYVTVNSGAHNHPHVRINWNTHTGEWVPSLKWMQHKFKYIDVGTVCGAELQQPAVHTFEHFLEVGGHVGISYPIKTKAYTVDHSGEIKKIMCDPIAAKYFALVTEKDGFLMYRRT